MSQAANAIHNVTVVNDVRRFPPDRAQDYLRSHNIDSILHRSDDGGPNAARILAMEAKALGANYMTMGGVLPPLEFGFQIDISFVAEQLTKFLAVGAM